MHLSSKNSKKSAYGIFIPGGFLSQEIRDTYSISFHFLLYKVEIIDYNFAKLLFSEITVYK